MEDYTLDEKRFFDALKRAGRTPDSNFLKTILANQPKTKPMLLRVMQGVVSADYGNLNELPISDSQRQLGVVTGRLLIEMRAIESLPLLGELYRQCWGDCVTVDGLDREPAHLGPTAIPIFEAILRMNSLGKWHNGKSISITILTDIALLFPETTDQIKAGLRSTLPALNANGGISAPRDEMWGSVAIALAKLRDAKSHKQVLAMIRQGVTDPAVITRERYERFYTGKQSPKVPERFDILKIYESNMMFEQMLTGLADTPVPEPPSHAQDLVSKAKRAEAKKLIAKDKIGRNDPCPCGSGKKFKNCCGK